MTINTSESAIEAIEELFIGAYGHTVTLEFLEGEDEINITIEGVEGILAEYVCDWAADESLNNAVVAAVRRTIQER